MRPVSSPCCVSPMPLSTQFIGGISLIPSGLCRRVALYVDPRSNKPWIFIQFAVRFFSEAPPLYPSRVLQPSFLCSVMQHLEASD
jgi:hypothetical protein